MQTLKKALLEYEKDSDDELFIIIDTLAQIAYCNEY